MFQRALQNIRYNLHVPMPVPWKTTSFLHHVFIDHTQTAESHVSRIIVIAKGESVIAVEPAEIKVAAIFRFANLDHLILSLLQVTNACSMSPDNGNTQSKAREFFANLCAPFARFAVKLSVMFRQSIWSS